MLKLNIQLFGGRGATSSGGSNSQILSFAKAKFEMSNGDYQGMLEAYLGSKNSIANYEELNSKVEKEYRKQMSARNKLLNNKEFVSLVKDTYGSTLYVKDYGLTINDIKTNMLNDIKDEISYAKNNNDQSQVNAYRKLQKFIKNYK